MSLDILQRVTMSVKLLCKVGHLVTAEQLVAHIIV